MSMEDCYDPNDSLIMGDYDANNHCDGGDVDATDLFLLQDPESVLTATTTMIGESFDAEKMFPPSKTGDAVTFPSSPHKKDDSCRSALSVLSPNHHRHEQQHRHYKRPKRSAANHNNYNNNNKKVATMAVLPTLGSPTAAASSNLFSPTKPFLSPSHDDRRTSSSSLMLAKRKSTASTTPYQKWKSGFQTYMIDHGCVGSLLIRGIEVVQDHHDDSSSPADRGNESLEDHSPGGSARLRSATRRSALLAPETTDQDRKKLLTKRDLESLRYVLVTKSRAEKLETILDRIFPHKQVQNNHHHHSGILSRHVVDTWEYINKALLRNLKVQSERLDWLIAMTYVVVEYDAWMYDHLYLHDDDNDHRRPLQKKEETNAFIKSLGGFWYRILKKDPDCLGWDELYTKPGIMELLHQLQTKVEDCPGLDSFAYSTP